MVVGSSLGIGSVMHMGFTTLNSRMTPQEQEGGEHLIISYELTGNESLPAYLRFSIVVACIISVRMLYRICLTSSTSAVR